MTNSNTKSKKMNKTTIALAIACAILFGVSIIAVCLSFNKAEELVDSNGVKLADYWVEKINDHSGRYILHVKAANEGFDVLACEISCDPSFDETQKFTFGAKAQTGDTSYTNEVVSLDAGSKLYLRAGGETYTIDIPADKDTSKSKKVKKSKKNKENTKIRETRKETKKVTTKVVKEEDDDKDDDKNETKASSTVKVVVPTATANPTDSVKITKINKIIDSNDVEENEIICDTLVNEPVRRPIIKPVLKPSAAPATVSPAPTAMATPSASAAPSATAAVTKAPENTTTPVVTETPAVTTVPDETAAPTKTPANDTNNDRENSVVINKVTVNETTINKETINETTINREVINETVVNTTAPTVKPEATTEPTTEPTVQPTIEPTDAPTKEPHTHDYKVVEKMEAKCTTDGHITYECSCGKTKTEVIKAHGHNMKVFLATEEYIEKHCQECGKVEKVYADKVDNSDKNADKDANKDDKAEENKVEAGKNDSAATENNTAVKNETEDKVKDDAKDDDVKDDTADNSSDDANNDVSDNNANDDDTASENTDNVADNAEEDVDLADDVIVLAGPR